MIVMLLATGVFLATIIVGKASYDDGDLTTGAFVLTLVGYGLLAFGELGRRRDHLRPRHARAPARRREPASRAMAPTGRRRRRRSGASPPRLDAELYARPSERFRASSSAARRSRRRPAPRP